MKPILFSTGCAVILLVSCSPQYFIDENEYLVNHNEVIELKSEKSISIIENLSEADVFFIGEVHGISENQQVTLKMLKDLNRQSGLTNYLAELGYSSAWLLNKFIQTGDEELLDYVLSGSAGTYFGTEETEAFIRGIRSLNNTLDEEKQFIYTGIDLDHQPASALRHLSDLDERITGAAPDKLYALLADIPEILTTGSWTRSDLYDLRVKDLWSDFSNNEQIYYTWCGEAFADELRLTLRNLYCGLYWYVEELCRTSRDNYILDNFKDVYESGEKYLGLWGNVHTPMSDVIPGTSYIASMLKTEGYRVASLLLMYFDSEGYNPGNPKFPVAVESSPLAVARLRAALEKSAEKDAAAVIFNLNAEGSPFLYSDNLGFSGDNTKAAADYYQACILLNGASSSKLYSR